MKKKLMMLLLAGVMVFGSTVYTFAEEEVATEEAAEEEINTLSMDMMDESLYEGIWINFAGGFDLYLPTDWNVLEIPEEQAEQGIVFNCAAPDETGLQVVVMANQLEEVTPLEQIYEELSEAYTGVEYGYINEIPVVSFETDVTYGVAFIDVNDIMYNVQFAPKAEEIDPILANILMSLSPTLVEEEEYTEAYTE